MGVTIDCDLGTVGIRVAVHNFVARDFSQQTVITNRGNDQCIQRKERDSRVSNGRPVSLDSIRRSNASTVSPAFNKSIICSMVNPACSPAMASLKTLDAMDGIPTMHPKVNVG